MGNPDGWVHRKGQGALAQPLDGGLWTGTGRCSLHPTPTWDGAEGQPTSSAWTEPQPWFSG